MRFPARRELQQSRRGKKGVKIVQTWQEGSNNCPDVARRKLHSRDVARRELQESKCSKMGYNSPGAANSSDATRRELQ